jgi:hypothetical protein
MSDCHTSATACHAFEAPEDTQAPYVDELSAGCTGVYAGTAPPELTAFDIGASIEGIRASRSLPVFLSLAISDC